MDIKTFLDNVYEHVCCPVCYNRFTDPKQLPCLHSFCLHCLQNIQATSGIRDTILCPECRRSFTIPGNGDLDTLPTNFRLNSLLDALPVTECKKSGIKCGNCEKTRQLESAYCFTCGFFWCDDCFPLHNRIRAYKEHHALALKDFEMKTLTVFSSNQHFVQNTRRRNWSCSVRYAKLQYVIRVLS